MKVLDLFSGIGGFSLGLERAGMETIAFCEIEKYPCSILKKHWPDVPIFNDVKELHAKDLPGAVDLICGGYPCQPFSVAGKRAGKDDDRHLWPEIVRIIRELDATTGKPDWCIFENVGGHVSMGLDQVLADLEGEGYTCWPFIIPACAVNAPHRRDRVWIVANYASGTDGKHNTREDQRQEPKLRKSSSRNSVSPGADTKHGDVSGLRASQVPQQQASGIRQNSPADTSHYLLDRGGDIRQAGRDEPADSGIVFADARLTLLQERPKRKRNRRRRDVEQHGCEKFRATDFSDLSEWITLPGVRSRDDGLPNRVARLKALGNSVVPQIPEIIGRAIMEVK
jgi:DNA (cytosine-5)-methyltransferase 1